jgi:hypothetical protein
MSIDRLTPLGSSGALEPESTFEDWVANGYVDELVTYTRLNRQFYRADSKINEIVGKGPKGSNPSSNMESVLKGFRSSSDFGTVGYDSHNEFDSGDASDEFVDLAVAIIGGSRKLICLDQTTALNVEIFDIETMSYDGPQTISSSSLPSDGNENWIPRAIVCDLDYAYISFGSDSSGSTYDNDHYLQAYRLSDWTVKSGWPATGLFLFDNGGLQVMDLLFANDNLLAVNDKETTITGGTSRAVILIDAATGTEDSYGAGDLSSDTADGICSNGQYIFIATPSYIGSMSIAAPSSGCGGTGWPRNVGSARIACLGDVVVSSNDSVAYVLNTSMAGIATITPVTDLITHIGEIETDGLNFWCRGAKYINGADQKECFIYKMKIHGLMGQGSGAGTPETAADEIFEPYALSRSDGHWGSRIIYDGDGIIAALDSFNGPGKLHKLPKTVLR